MKSPYFSLLVLALPACCDMIFVEAFVKPTFVGDVRSSSRFPVGLSITMADKVALEEEKKKFLDLVYVTDPNKDTLLADPFTKEPLRLKMQTKIARSNEEAQEIKYVFTSATNTYAGSSDTFINLLEPVNKDATDASFSYTASEKTPSRTSNLLRFTPPLFRSLLGWLNLPVGDEFVVMRDLFSSPSISFAYERGWRQTFVNAGFPGPDKEAAMAMDFFEPAMAKSSDGVVIDMSCATGIFTRRFASSGKYKNVLGCDYSESMLEEARRLIQSDPDMQNLAETSVNLVRLDVGQLPMKSGSVQALHAGAAMHCWPDLPKAVSEIYRVLKPGSRYFATTFLSSYFQVLKNANDGTSNPSTQALQYFETTDELRLLLEDGGFEREKIHIEVLGSACVVIRCEK